MDSEAMEYLKRKGKTDYAKNFGLYIYQAGAVHISVA